MKRPCLALLASLLPWAAPLTSAAGAPAIKYCTTATKGALLAYFANDSNPPPGSNKALAFWHPMEVEFVFKDNLYHVDAADTAYFSGPAGGSSPFKKDFPAASAAAVKGTMDGAKNLAAAVRPKVQKEAALAKDGAEKSTALNAFSDTELHFLECRMKATGNDAAFQTQRAAAHANPDALGKFVIYYRAFMASELQQYMTESAALPAGSPVDYVSLHQGLLDRTAAAVGSAGKGPFAPLNPVTQPAQPDNACAKLPAKQQDDLLSQDECNLLSNEQQKQYLKDMVGAGGDMAAAKTVVAKYRALAASIKNPFPDAGTAATLSAAEAKYMSDADKKDYLAKLAKATSNPKWKTGDPDDGSKEALTGLDRNSLNNLGKDELTALGASSDTMKAAIEKLPVGSEDRMKMVQNDRQVSAAILNHKSLPKQFANAKDLAQYLADHPNDRECVWTGNCNTGVVSGPGNVGAGGTSPGTGPGTGSTAPDQPNIQGPDTTKTPPIPDQVDAKTGSGGMAALKKDLPAIGNGIRMGIWAAILGFFVAGPAGVLMFGLCGAVAGFGITKINGMIGS